MKLELKIWIAIVFAILSFFVYLINKIASLYGDDVNERYKNKRKK